MHCVSNRPNQIGKLSLVRHHMLAQDNIHIHSKFLPPLAHDISTPEPSQASVPPATDFCCMFHRHASP